jgi:NAD(P)-dependent dehydrogenase (short-subunit alcohol dehydrogenase family)
MKTVLITGANRGIGLEHARSFAARGLKVLATARFPKAAEELNSLVTNHVGKITVLRYDAADPESPGMLKLALKDTPLDLLLANAGVGSGERESFGSVDLQDVLELIRINSIAPLKLAEVLTENVARSGRKLMAFQSSQLGSIGNNTSGGRYGYRMSKAALNMVAKGIACDLGSLGVIAVALHPGWVKTRMGGASAPVSVQGCVAGQQRLFDQLTLANSGHFFNYDGAKLAW